VSTEAPERDVSAPQPEPATPDVSEEQAGKRKKWTEFKGVIESTTIDEVDRLKIVAGVNEYKGNHYVFLGKVTEADFQRAFFSMPAYVWQKALPILSDYAQRIGVIEKQAMAKAVLDELKRLKELGIDIKAITDQL